MLLKGCQCLSFLEMILLTSIQFPCLGKKDKVPCYSVNLDTLKRYIMLINQALSTKMVTLSKYMYNPISQVKLLRLNDIGNPRS